MPSGRYQEGERKQQGSRTIVFRNGRWEEESEEASTQSVPSTPAPKSSPPPSETKFSDEPEDKSPEGYEKKFGPLVGKSRYKRYLDLQKKKTSSSGGFEKGSMGSYA